MNTADYLTLANILVAFLGVMFAIGVYLEWRSLRTLRKSMESLREDILSENAKAMKAAHRVIASYNVADVDARIALLKDTLAAYPSAFNGYSSLGYAFLEKGAHAEAIDAFREAMGHFPHDKATYCDLAFAYYAQGEEELAIKFFSKAVAVDASAQEDIVKDVRLSEQFTQRFTDALLKTEVL